MWRAAPAVKDCVARPAPAGGRFAPLPTPPLDGSVAAPRSPVNSRLESRLMNSTLILVISIINIYIYCLVASVVMSWLIHFEVVNTRNRFVYIVYDTLTRLTEPALKRIRRIMPNLGGLDLSPIVLIMLLYFGQNLVIEYWPR
jgi:YggT family protein